MNVVKVTYVCILFLVCTQVSAQGMGEKTQSILDSVEMLQLENRLQEALQLLQKGIQQVGESNNDMAYLYAYQSGMYIAMDSLMTGKMLLDKAMEHADSPQAKAVSYRAKAFLNSYLNEPDDVVEDALTGLKYVENVESELITKYYLNYLLYSAYSRWGDKEKMKKYILECERYADQIAKPNLRANANNGISSMFLADYTHSNNQASLDSAFHYLQKSFDIQHENPTKVSGNTFAITCINLANFYLQHSTEPLHHRKEQAYHYLGFVEKMVRTERASADKWVNIYGIKSGFAKLDGDLVLAEQYLVQGLGILASNEGNYFRQEYAVNKDLSEIVLKKGETEKALQYQQRAEEVSRKLFDQQQAFNAQKLEIQFETEKKNEQLAYLTEIAEFRKTRNYLYGGLAIALFLGFAFMFRSYYFRLRYSLEREKKMAQEKEDAERQALMQLQIEKEEQARLKAEQELSDLKRQQLEKEALANTLIIEHKNDMLKQIKDTLIAGNAHNVQKLLKEEMLLNADFEDVKMQIQQLHPTFFNQLTEKSQQKLTPLDMKYCAYLYLQMTTKQIAQVLHVEPQSVRMFKYRLKQKFGLGKDVDLESFLLNLNHN